MSNNAHLDWFCEWPAPAEAQLMQLANEMAIALSRRDIFWFADITAVMKTGFCQEIFPSQRFTERPDNHDEPSKKLATVECLDGQLAACLHAQKVGAALQQIDDWWAGDADQPLRVHQYGADSKNLTSMRHPVSGQDFYHLLGRADEFLELMRSSSASSPLPGEIHYLMAVLTKGGLFQKGKG